MSRVGKKPVPLPKGVEAKVDGSRITVKGPKGTLSRTLPDQVVVESSNGQIVLKLRNEKSTVGKKYHGLSRSLVANMVHVLRLLFSQLNVDRRRLPCCYGW